MNVIFKLKAENGIIGTNRKHISSKKQNILSKAASIGSNLPPKAYKLQLFAALPFLHLHRQRLAVLARAAHTVGPAHAAHT
eukprot:4941024-Pleurochrysis_carterae.AAC.1